MKSRYKAKDIAYWFIMRNRMDIKNKTDNRMSLMKLMRLMYYAEGCCIGINKYSLFPEKIIARETGPAVTEVSDMFGWPCTMNVPKKKLDKAAEKIKKKDRMLLDSVYDTFGNQSASELSLKSRLEDPWKVSSKDGDVLNKEIPRKLIKSYFKKNYVKE